MTDWADGVSFETAFNDYGGCALGLPKNATMMPGEYLAKTEENLHKAARNIYRQRLALGVAREQARKDLPLSTYTEAY